MRRPGHASRLSVAATAVLLNAAMRAAAPQSSVSPQGPLKVPPPVFRVSSQIVQFDAVVLDREGRPVTSLKRADFEVLQDGVPVTLRDVTFVDRQARGTTTPLDPERTPILGVDVEPLVFLIDDMAMTPDGFHRVQRGLRQFVAEALPAGFEVGILRTGQRGRRTTSLTSDVNVLLKRIDEMRYLARSLRPGLASGSGASGPGGRELARIFVEGTLGSLNSLLADLRRLPGRKTVVLLSEGVAIDMSSHEYGAEPVEGRLNRLAQLAAEAGATTHCVDVAGVTAAGNSLLIRMSLRDGLVTIADRMGGLYLGLENDIIAPLKRVAAIEHGYYLLSYEPPEGTFVSDGKPPFRKLSLRVRGEGLTARTRAGFFGAR